MCTEGYAYSIEFTMDKKVLDTISLQKAIETWQTRKKALNTHLSAITQTVCNTLGFGARNDKR